jgi:ABC-type enterochelin transport system permease subunit
MTWQVAIMFAVAAVFALLGAALLLALMRPSGPAKVYVFRMVGIMALALGAVLAASATAMWRWSNEVPQSF